MLVLSRRENSSLKIGPDVTITVLSVKRQQVRIGIEAPRNIRVLRDELWGDESEQPELAGVDVSGLDVSGLDVSGLDISELNISTTDVQKKTVLVIEDDPIHARLICKSLSGTQRTTVRVAETAKLALEALGALVGSENEDVIHPDLILLDMGLPDSTGLEVLRAIRRDDRLRTTPVVMLSCSDDESVVQECVETGANAFVVKSPRWEDFRASVSRIGEFWTNDSFMPRRSRVCSKAPGKLSSPGTGNFAPIQSGISSS